MCPFKSLVGHFTNLKGFNLLTDNTLKKLIQDVLVRCLVSTFDHDVKLAECFQNLVRQCRMTDFYFQHGALNTPPPPYHTHTHTHTHTLVNFNSLNCIEP